MNIITYPERKDWPEILKRPRKSQNDLNELVRRVLRRIKSEGDKAVKDYELQFDKVELNNLAVTSQEIKEAEQLVSTELRKAIELAHKNIETFHRAQQFKTVMVNTADGVTCWQKAVPIEKVGLYIPGGTAPLFSTVLMLATPAKIAGCKEIVLCSPPSKNGKIHPAILVAAKVAGVDRIFKAGGVQAIGAMAYGTDSIPKVYKIFGPGNQYVTAAKQIVSLEDVAIDMPAGPSEVAVVADESSNPEFVSADLLSQAEHGADSQVILVSTRQDVIERIIDSTSRQLQLLSRKDLALAALQNSKFILLHNENDLMDLINEYAPEHLILAVDDYMRLYDKVVNAGSVFLGHYSCESAGDYASGTNHTLPTSGYAKAFSGVSLDSYIRKITFQELSPQGVMSIGRAVEIMAHNEQLTAHENAMALRLNKILENK